MDQNSLMVKSTSPAVSSLEVLQGTYSAAPFGMTEAQAGHAFTQNLAPVFGTLFTIMSKKGIIYMSGKTNGNSWTPDMADVGGSSTNEELQFAFMNIFTDSDIKPTTISDYAVAKRTYPTPGVYSWILSPTKALAVAIQVIRRNLLESMTLDIRITDRYGAALTEVMTVTKSFAASNSNEALLVVPVANFAPRLTQAVVIAPDSDTFNVVEDTQNLIGVVDPNTIIKADGITVGYSLEVKGDNCDVFITVIPYTIGNVAGFIDYSSKSRNVTFKG